MGDHSSETVEFEGTLESFKFDKVVKDKEEMIIYVTGAINLQGKPQESFYAGITEKRILCLFWNHPDYDEIVLAFSERLNLVFKSDYRVEFSNSEVVLELCNLPSDARLFEFMTMQKTKNIKSKPKTKPIPKLQFNSQPNYMLHTKSSAVQQKVMQIYDFNEHEFLQMQIDYNPYKWVVEQIKPTSLTYFIQTYQEACNDPQKDVSMLDANDIEEKSECLLAWVKLMNTFKQPK